MDPAPSPGNHGNHQQAARLAVEAFYAAADPKAFPEQLTKEELKPFAPARLLLGGGTRHLASRVRPAPRRSAPPNPAQNVYGVWGGRASQSQGKTWAAHRARGPALRTPARAGPSSPTCRPTRPSSAATSSPRSTRACRSPSRAPRRRPPRRRSSTARYPPGRHRPARHPVRPAPSTFDVRPGTAFTVRSPRPPRPRERWAARP